MSESIAHSLPIGGAQGSQSPKGAPKQYEIGTLRYTLAGLFGVFAWLLWGDFCFVIFESIVPRFVPLFMNELGASNTLIGVVTATVPGVVNLVFLPAISMGSDRYRSSWGRRIPFLLWATPCTAVAIFLIGYTPELGTWLHAKVLSSLWAITPTQVILFALCVFAVMYHFFNMVINSMYYCLFQEVVPAEVLSRFLAMARVVGTLGSFLFSRYLMGYVMSHRKVIFTACSLLCVVSFLLMCWRVREGEHPPPPPKRGRGIWFAVRDYLRVFVRIPLYRNYYVLQFVGGFMSGTGAFALLFAQNTLGLSLDEIGKVQGWTYVVQAMIYLPAGYLCDRFNPLRVCLVTVLFNAVVALASYFYIRGGSSYLVFSIVAQIPMVFWITGMGTVGMVLLHRENYGQLFSNGVILMMIGATLGGYAAGVLLDVFKDYYIIFLWGCGFWMLLMVPLVLLYRSWRRHGGPHHYEAPAISECPEPS